MKIALRQNTLTDGRPGPAWLLVGGQYEPLEDVRSIGTNETQTLADVTFHQDGRECRVSGPVEIIRDDFDPRPAGMVMDTARGDYVPAAEAYDRLVRFADRAAQELHDAMLGQPELEGAKWQNFYAYQRAAAVIRRLLTERMLLTHLRPAELQLIHQGLSVIGEQERVDPALLEDWNSLLTRVHGALEYTVREAAEQSEEASDEQLHDGAVEGGGGGGAVEGEVVGGDLPELQPERPEPGGGQREDLSD